MKQLTDEQREQILALREDGFHARVIASILGIPQKKVEGFFNNFSRANKKKGFSEYTNFRFNVLLDRFIAGLSYKKGR